MRSWFVAFAATALFTVVAAHGEEAAAPTSTEEAAAAPAEEAAAPAAAAEEETAAEAAGETAAAAPRHTVKLGPVGYDDAGQSGRIHEVAKGDTLWDISDAYLGTPWVWPSVWQDNDAIENPHLILPGDKLWITPREMRRIGEAEASRMLAGSGDVPAAMADGLGGPEIYHYSPLEGVGFVSTSDFAGATSILDSPEERTWLADHDTVVVGYGRGEGIEEGQQLEIFRRGESVKHPETGQPLGWNIEVLGWLEVTRVEDESSVAVIRRSFDEMRRGDKVRPRPRIDFDIPIAGKPEVVGMIVHTPPGRMEMGDEDIVYIDRGSADGLLVGSPLEVYRPMTVGIDRVGPFDRKLPDRVVAKMIVVSTEPSASAAVVTHSSEEITRGDRFRGSDSLK